MFKKILIANRGDNAAGVATKGNFARFAHAKLAVVTLRCSRSELGD